MNVVNIILATTGLLQAASARVVTVERDLSGTVRFPATKINFAKDNVPAKWAPGFPKEWGTQDFSYQFNVPDPSDNFDGLVTDDEKYLVLFNGTHVRFTDLDKNVTATTLRPEIPQHRNALLMKVRTLAQGGYDVIVSGDPSYGDAEFTVRQRLGADLQPTGVANVYDGGVASISPSGRLATTHGNIYDLESSDGFVAKLEGNPGVRDQSLSPDGTYLATVDWQEKTAILWNATSGKKIMDFPATEAQNWLIRFSPDGKYVAICLGAGTAKSNIIQIYALADPTAAPVEIGPFNDWPRELDWSETNKQIAIGDNGRVHVYDVPSKQEQNTWQVDASANIYTPTGITWHDEGKKISWIWRDGQYLYDFETNTEWLFIVSNKDHSWGRAKFFLLKKKGYAVTVDGDSTVRFWKI